MQINIHGNHFDKDARIIGKMTIDGKEIPPAKCSYCGGTSYPELWPNCPYCGRPIK